ncbi:MULTISPECIES: hypothetical protein [Legionella]|uniref:Uncharacterized protein n=1 Tax=Legionella drozanskii LLAP-1 TaxID=1212489 RepID=A0A0W0SVU0_9GAMM|nr:MULTISPECIES: hypothetical protein [Legionella]KTC87496.1 hypothetical protein Ldro_1115 [Legionella drozanskii LLAP-1]PJE10471.1 MAG: hypothetical protein CK430_10335 [Legionella sp.]
MRKYFLATAALLSSHCFAAASSVNFEGNYDCHGNEIGSNAPFKCQMNVKKTGDTYASTASCSDGNSYSGTGIYDANTQRLSTGFVNPKKAEETGVSVSEIKTDGSITTVWTYLNSTSTGRTICTKQQLSETPN